MMKFLLMSSHERHQQEEQQQQVDDEPPLSLTKAMEGTKEARTATSSNGDAASGLKENGDIEEFEQDLIRLNEHLVKLKSLESAIFQEESAYKSELVKRKKRLRELTSEIKMSTFDSSKLMEFQSALSAIEARRPTSVPFLLWVAMGSAKLVLPDRERLQYKASYERFKVFATMTHLLLSLLLLLITRQPWLDAVSNFFLLYAYSTMTIREHILRLNGSAMQLWWIWHHYLCVILAGVLVVWPSGATYYHMRTHLLLFMVYIAAVQILQYRYQMSRLYTLRALSRVGPMQTTTDSASVHIFNGLGFLLPFLLIGHLMQFYTSFQFFKMYYSNGYHNQEWQLMAISILFAMIATGNISTTLYVVFQKWKRRGMNPNSASLSMRSRTFSNDSRHLKQN